MGTSANVFFRLRRRKAAARAKRGPCGERKAAPAAASAAASTAAEGAAEGSSAEDAEDEVDDYGGIRLNFDGDPGGQMTRLAHFLANCTVVNGIGAGHASGSHANGPDCLFAQAIVLAKGSRIGSVYLLPASVKPGPRRYVDFEYVVELVERAPGEPGAGPSGGYDTLISVSPYIPPEDGGELLEKKVFTIAEYMDMYMKGYDPEKAKLAEAMLMRLEEQLAQAAPLHTLKSPCLKKARWTATAGSQSSSSVALKKELEEEKGEEEEVLGEEEEEVEGGGGA